VSTTRVNTHKAFFLPVGAGACVMFEKDAYGAWHQFKKCANAI